MYLFVTILFCMSTDVPIHHYTCSVYFFFFSITCTMTFQLISGYLPADPPENTIYLFTLMLLLCLRTKNYLSPQLLLYLPIDVPVHDPTCSFAYFHSDQPLRTTRQRFHCSTCPQTYLFTSTPVQFFFLSFSA